MATAVKIGTGTITSPVLAGGITNASITTTTGRPYSTATMDVDTGLKLEIINKKLQIESTLGEVFLDIGSDIVFTGKKVSIPDACIMRMTSEKGPRTQTMAIANPLAGVGRGGNAEDQRGYERNRTLEYMKVYYNEFSQAVMEEAWGVNYNDLQVVNYYAESQPGLSKWFAEDEGYQYREALVERYSWPLEKAPVSATQSLNPNVYVANTEIGSQPAYDNTAATFRTNVNTALAAADTGTSGVNANLDLDQLIYIDYYACNSKRIEPVTIGGKQSYILLVPSTQLTKLTSTNAGQLGSLWKDVTCLSEEEQNFPGIAGRVKSLIIVEDQRYPTLKCTNSYADSTHTYEYVKPGNIDNRNKSVYAADSNAAWDICLLMGKGAILDWTVTPLHFERQPDEYGKRNGLGGFIERGIQLGNTYDTDTASNKNIKNFGSMICLFSAVNVAVTA